MTGVRATATRDAPSPIREALSLLEGAMRFPEDAEMFVALSGPALVHLAALEAVADAARECREAMLAERADLLMENGPVFIEMLEEPLARLVAVRDGQTAAGGGRGSSDGRAPLANGEAPGSSPGPGLAGDVPRPSAAVCPCRVHGDPDGDCGEECG